MNESLLKEELIRYEGYRTDVYADTLGLTTGGIGHRTSLPVGTQVDISQIQAWYQSDVQAALSIAKRIYTNFPNIDEVRQRVLIQLCFNMGNHIIGFRDMNAAILKCDWNTAADELQDSKWCGQVGRRCSETCFALRNGEYGWR